MREHVLTAADFVYPLFVADGTGVDRAIAALPGHQQRSVDRLPEIIDEIVASGVFAVLLFGLPATKDGEGSAAWDPEGPVPRAIRLINERAPGLVVMADVCLCAYTDHGHCGLIGPGGDHIMNDATLALLGKAAVTYAAAGADIVAPSAMMDRQVAAIRSALDGHGHEEVAILAYAAKFASVLYGPFREAAGSRPAFGDRRSYQLDPANGREAVAELEAAVEQGANLVMVKPGATYLDIIARARDVVRVPIVAYQVSGEYAMLKAAAAAGVADERALVVEQLLAFKRAGADLIISYYALELGRWLERA